MDGQINLLDIAETLEPLSEARVERAIRAEQGMKPKFHKGKYGIKYDHWTCGQCGQMLKHDVGENYCWNCGYRVLWDNPRCLTGYRSIEL